MIISRPISTDCIVDNREGVEKTYAYAIHEEGDFLKMFNKVVKTLYTFDFKLNLWVPFSIKETSELDWYEYLLFNREEVDPITNDKLINDKIVWNIGNYEFFVFYREKSLITKNKYGMVDRLENIKIK
jgi:hypothetical protein